MTGLLVIAKEPVPGRVKTRLCPPATPEQAAALAAAALADTLDAVADTPATDRTLVLSGSPTMPVPRGVQIRAQRGEGLDDRLANAFADTRRRGVGSLLIGMDTPQAGTGLLASAVHLLSTVDAVLGPAADGGWWALGLRDPRHAEVLRGVPMSTPDTGRDTLAALRHRGLRYELLPVLRDVDTAADARAVAAGMHPRTSRFARAVADLLPAAA